MDSSYSEIIQRLSVQLVPFIMAVVFHEYAHGLIAYQWGDKTAQERGRLTLNPVPHLDPIGTVLFPLINLVTGIPLLFGWARPVPIDPRRFRRPRLGLFWVSLAGPGMNFLLATLSAALLCALIRWVPPSFYLFEPFERMAGASIGINFALGIFNLIPLPPLDGSKVIESFLSSSAARRYESLARFSLIILLVLLWTRALEVLTYPIEFCSNVTIYAMARLFHLPQGVL